MDEPVKVHVVYEDSTLNDHINCFKHVDNAFADLEVYKQSFKDGHIESITITPLRS